jgi:hypothetical protein
MRYQFGGGRSRKSQPAVTAALGPLQLASSLTVSGHTLRKPFAFIFASCSLGAASLTRVLLPTALRPSGVGARLHH